MVSVAVILTSCSSVSIDSRFFPRCKEFLFIGSHCTASLVLRKKDYHCIMLLDSCDLSSDSSIHDFVDIFRPLSVCCNLHTSMLAKLSAHASHGVVGFHGQFERRQIDTFICLSSIIADLGLSGHKTVLHLCYCHICCLVFYYQLTLSLHVGLWLDYASFLYGTFSFHLLRSLSDVKLKLPCRCSLAHSQRRIVGTLRGRQFLICTCLQFVFYLVRIAV
jgi:hypothetical protein